MKKQLLIVTSLLCALPLQNHLHARATTKGTTYVGYRLDNIKWQLQSGPSFSWSNVNSIAYGLRGETCLKNIVFLYDVGLANVLGATMKDTRYFNPTGAPSSPNLKGWGIDFRPDLGLGYRFKPKKWLEITPAAGYDYRLTYFKDNKRAGPFVKLSDTLQRHGPWFGVDTLSRIRKVSVGAGLYYKGSFYRNSGSWHLVSTPLVKNTFNQSSFANGMVGKIKVAYNPTKTVALGIESVLEWQQGSSGSDSRNFGNAPTVSSKYKTVNWKTFDTRLTLTKTF